jgi:hypothetical protein
VSSYRSREWVDIAHWSVFLDAYLGLCGGVLSSCLLRASYPNTIMLADTFQSLAHCTNYFQRTTTDRAASVF